MNEKIDIEVRKRKLTVELEGFTPLQVHQFAQDIEERMLELEKKWNVFDTQKLGILVALELAAEVGRLKEAQDNDARVVERKLEEMTLALQSALAVSNK